MEQHKKIRILPLLACTWILCSGFTGLDNAGSGVISDGMEGMTETEIGILVDPGDLSGSNVGVVSSGIAQISGTQAYALVQILDWSDKCMANVTNRVNIREEPDASSTLTGAFYKGDMGYVLERSNGWTRIQSGEVEGWVQDDYLAFGEDALTKAEEDTKKTGMAVIGDLAVYAEPDRDTEEINTFGEGEEFEVGNEVEGFFEVISADGGISYVPAEYVKVTYDYGEATTAEELAAQAARKSARYQTLEAVNASTDELALLAALIQAEAANQSYEGQVAVGAVVMNRVKSSKYPNTIYGVISQPWQFTPWMTGRVQNILAKGANASCYTAAQVALNGETTVGTCLYFRVNDGRNGIVIGAHVFY